MAALREEGIEQLGAANEQATEGGEPVERNGGTEEMLLNSLADGSRRWESP